MLQDFGAQPSLACLLQGLDCCLVVAHSVYVEDFLDGRIRLILRLERVDGSIFRYLVLPCLLHD